VLAALPLRLMDTLTSDVRQRSLIGKSCYSEAESENSREGFLSVIAPLPFWSTPGASPAALKAMLATDCNSRVRLTQLSAAG
jgi:hypothetical protein